MNIKDPNQIIWDGRSRLILSTNILSGQKSFLRSNTFLINAKNIFLSSKHKSIIYGPLHNRTWSWGLHVKYNKFHFHILVKFELLTTLKLLQSDGCDRIRIGLNMATSKIGISSKYSFQFCSYNLSTFEIKVVPISFQLLKNSSG